MVKAKENWKGADCGNTLKATRRWMCRPCIGGPAGDRAKKQPD